MWRYGILLLLAVTTAHGQRQQSTAYDALLVVRDQFSRAALKRVISVSGVEGDPQPAQWTVLIADRRAAGGVRELQIAEGRIVANRVPTGNVTGSVENAMINTAQLNLDSDGAFTVASYTADKSHTNFDAVSYTLRTNERGTPVWIVTVHDATGAPLGTIHISANRGNVTRVEGMYRGANMANVEQDPVAQSALSDGPGIESGPGDDYIEPPLGDEGSENIDDGDDADDNVVKRRIKQMFRRTKRDAQRLFQRVRRPFDEFSERRHR